MVYDDDLNRAAAVVNLLLSYLEEELIYISGNISPVSKNNTSDDLIMPQLAPARSSINFHSCACQILTGLCALVTAVLCTIFPFTYFQLPVSVNVAYVQRLQQHLQTKLCGGVSSSSEGTYLGLYFRGNILILFTGENASWVPIEQSGDILEVYGYQGNQDLPGIL